MKGVKKECHQQKDGITETVSYTEERAKDKTAGTPINMWTHWENKVCLRMEAVAYGQDTSRKA